MLGVYRREGVRFCGDGGRVGDVLYEFGDEFWLFR